MHTHYLFSSGTYHILQCVHGGRPDDNDHGYRHFESFFLLIPIFGDLEQQSSIDTNIELDTPNNNLIVSKSVPLL